ncbi:MAG TPA: hypothetical protein VIZ28_08335 [Chitinophagaceae bacterium]
MKYLIAILLLIFFKGCYVPNDPPKSEFSFGFHGRLERLEDAFYLSALTYRERDFNQHLQSSPEYEFIIVRSDTTINFIVTLVDCQSISSLVKWNDNWNCDSSYVIIKKVSSNIDSLPNSEAKSIFKKEIIDHLTDRFNSVTNIYRWTIEKKQDTVLVKILNQNDYLRKLYIYSFDSVGNDIAEKEIINYLGDSTIIYKNSPEQRYMYLKSKLVVHK